MSPPLPPGTRRAAAWRLALLPLLVATGAAGADVPRTDVSVGLSTLTYQSFFRSSAPHTGVELLYERALDGTLAPLRLGAGVRGGLPTQAIRLPLEGFVRARLVARLGVWEPAAGPELGLTGRAVLGPQPSGLPGVVDTLAEERLGPVYVAFTAAPLRLRLGPWLLSALEVQVGTGLPHAGAAARLQLGLLSVGVGL